MSSPPPDASSSDSSVSIIPPGASPPADESAVVIEDDADGEGNNLGDESDELTAEERAEEERLTREAKVSTISRSAAAERFRSR